MALIADGLLVLAALAASLYCWVLSRRLRRLTQLDQGLGAAISSLSEQVEEMQAALNQSKQGIEQRTAKLDNLTRQSEKAAKRLGQLIEAAKTRDADEPAPEVVLRVEEPGKVPATPVENNELAPEEKSEPVAEIDPAILASLLSMTQATKGGDPDQGLGRLLKALKLNIEEQRS